MWDLDTIKRLNAQAEGILTDDHGRRYIQKTIRGQLVRLPIPEPRKLPAGVVIINHS